MLFIIPYQLKRETKYRKFYANTGSKKNTNLIDISIISIRKINNNKILESKI